MVTSSIIIYLVGNRRVIVPGWAGALRPTGDACWMGWWKGTCPTVSLPPEDLQIKVKHGQMFWKSNRAPCSPTECGQMAGPWGTGQKARNKAEDSCSSLAEVLTLSGDLMALRLSPLKEIPRTADSPGCQ